MYYFSKIILLSQEKEPLLIKRLFFCTRLVIASVLVVAIVIASVLVVILIVSVLIVVLVIVVLVSVFVLVSVLVIHNFLPKPCLKKFDLSVFLTLSSIMPTKL